MPLIAAQYHPATGPLLQLAIVKITSDIADSGAADLTVLNPKLYLALVDTGASCTCISPKVVEEVGLDPTGKSEMIGATGASAVNNYNFGVGFLIDPQPTSMATIKGSLYVKIVDGLEFYSPAAPFDVLLGRDIICQGSFSLSFDGHQLLALS